MRTKMSLFRTTLVVTILSGVFSSASAETETVDFFGNVWSSAHSDTIKWSSADKNPLLDVRFEEVNDFFMVPPSGESGSNIFAGQRDHSGPNVV